MEKIAVNLGSGQRRFESVPGVIQWINIDLLVRDDQVPDVVGDGRHLPLPPGTANCAVLHHVLEHFGCDEGSGMLRQCWECLKPGGSLLVFVPDLKALAQRWLLGQIDDFTFMVNVYGAYQGDEGDRHRWGYGGYAGLGKYLCVALNLHPEKIRPFDWREVPGADIARDWWIMGLECVK